MDQNVDEDLIEATIRRVAEAQAARAASTDETEAGDTASTEPAAGDSPSAVEDALTPPEPEIAEAEDPEPEPPVVDESAIEATIRRVAAARAERETAEPAPSAPAPVEQPLTFVPRGGAAPAAALRDYGSADEPDWGEAIARIERTLGEMHAMLRSLVDGSATPAVQRGDRPQPAADDWEDEAPPVQRMPFTAPPRPSVLRDVTPAAATPVQPAGDDARPAPGQPAPARPDSRRGFDLLPRTYRITVEDKRRGVDLVPLHRALLAMDGVRDMSLLSYNNGVAIVALETVNDVDTQVLGSAIGRAMSREAAVEVHNERTLVVKLAED